MATDLYAALEHAIPAVREEFETLLHDLVQIPTVSMDPAHAADIQRGAHQAAALLQACGATVEIVETPGNPVVFGQLIVNCFRRLVVEYIESKEGASCEGGGVGVLQGVA